MLANSCQICQLPYFSGKPKPDEKHSRAKQPEKQSTMKRNDDRRSRVGNLKLDHFIVLVACVVILAFILVPFIICHFVRQIGRPGEERRTCAAYYLMTNEQQSKQAENVNPNDQKHCIHY